MRDEIFPALVASTGDAILRDAITDGRLRVVSSGNDMPVIDLRFVSREVRDEAKDADLIVLEGMGTRHRDQSVREIKGGLRKARHGETSRGGRVARW